VPASWAQKALRGIGVLLALASVAPAYGLLEGSSGVAAAQFLSAGPAQARAALVGTVVVFGLGLVFWPVAARATTVMDGLCSRWPVSRLAVVAGVVAFLTSVTFSMTVLGGGPYLVDGMSQLLQARIFASGALELTSDAPIAFSYYQYLAPTLHGWASQYPPGFAALLAGAMLFGAPAFVGPAVHGVTAWLGVRFASVLFKGDRHVVLVTAVLLVVSPFSLALAGAYMSHGLAALLGMIVVYASVRAEASDRPLACGVVGGLSVGLLATVRPLTALCVAVVAGTTWLLGKEWAASESTRDRLRFPAASVLAGIPPVGLLLWFNRSLFGGPLTFGYTAAQGPAHGLGFHVDPWGATYGAKEAVAYAATEIQALGTELLGLPVPMVLWIGLALLFFGRQTRSLGVLVGWAGSLVIAGFLYWHHDLSMGPRLLADAAPAWFMLAAWAMVTTLRGSIQWKDGAYAGYARGIVVTLGLGVLVAVPLRLADYSQGASQRGLVVEEVPEAGALVFVHDSWESRLAGRMAGVGLRDDQIRSALAIWSTCQLHTQLARLESGELPREALESNRNGGSALITRTMPSGSRIRTYDGEMLTNECEGQAASDFRGVSGLPQRSWRGDLPGVERGRPMYVRDLGPAKNEEMLRRYTSREAWVLVSDGPASTARLMPYVEAMALLW
jgi:hypothetical protein